MRIHSCALGIVLGTCAYYSPSTIAFLHSPPRTSVFSSRKNYRSSLATGSSDDSPSLISQLAFYPSDEPLSERLKNVQAEWDDLKKEGVGKFFADELGAAERIVRGDADDAERGASAVIEKGGSGGEGGDDYLLKEGFRGMGDAGKRLASEMKEVRQEFDELKAAKIVERVAEDVVRTEALVEKDLEKVVKSVASSLEEAEEAVQAALAAVSSKEGLTDIAKSELTENLESKAQNIEQSIRVADSVAKTAKQIAVEDERVMSQLERTGDRLLQAIDATESLATTLRGAEGGGAVDAASVTVGRTAAVVREDLQAAESIAGAVGQKVAAEADAVTDMVARAAGSAGAARAAGSSIRGSMGDGGGGSGPLASALEGDAREIRADGDGAGRLAEAIGRDAAANEEELEALERSSKEVDSLIDAVDDAVDEAEDVTAGEASAGTVKEAVDKIEEEVKEVEESISDAEDVTEKSEDSKAKELTDENEADVEAGAESSSSEVGEGEVRVEADSKLEGEGKFDKERDLDVAESPSEVKQVSMNDDDPMQETLPEKAITTASADDTRIFENDAVGDETAGESHATTTANAGHDVDSLGDAAAGTFNGAHHTSDSATDAVETATNSIGGEDLADALASAHPPENLENAVASVASQVGDSISSSDAVHDVATLTTDALAEAVAIASSVFL